MFTYFSNIFLAIRRTVDNSERLLSFPRHAQQAFERERKGFKLGRGKGEGRREWDPYYFSLARARACPNFFPLPFRRPATNTIFFLHNL